MHLLVLNFRLAIAEISMLISIAYIKTQIHLAGAITTLIYYDVASISAELSCHKYVLGHEVSTVILYIDCLCDFKSDGAS